MSLCEQCSYSQCGDYARSLCSERGDCVSFHPVEDGLIFLPNKETSAPEMWNAKGGGECKTPHTSMDTPQTNSPPPEPLREKLLTHRGMI